MCAWSSPRILPPNRLPPLASSATEPFTSCLSARFRLPHLPPQMCLTCTWGHHMKRGKTYAKAVKLVDDGGFCCKKREKRLDFHSDQSVRALSSLQVKPPEKRIHSLAYVLPRFIW